MVDICIIGAGVTGAAVARELSRYEGRILVLEKGDDVCSGTSKANSAIVHAGYDCTPGSMMARMNIRGNEMMTELSRDLDIPFRRIGSMVVCTHEEEKEGIEKLYIQGVKNGVPGLSILTPEDARKLEPNLSDDVVSVLYAPSAGIICPFELNLGLAESASINGVEFRFDTEVKTLQRTERGTWCIRTSGGEIEAGAVVNAAGVYADVFHNMVSGQKITIIPRKGEYCLLDKNVSGFVRHVIFPQPTRFGKGVLVAPTVHGNTIVGPTARDIEDKEGNNTTAEGLGEVIEKAEQTMKHIPMREVITSFAGLRAHEVHHEFILRESAEHFFDCAGIESPGLTSSPAIGEYMAAVISERERLTKKAVWEPCRKAVRKVSELPPEERNALIRENPAYGQIVCRCESVSEGEILEAIHRPLGARSLDGVKRRTRAGMGRCQAGFCSPRVMDILQREWHVPMEEIKKNGGKSCIVVGRTKEA